jgi:16S rRNA (uracil1498-N3)-methyltransferase
MRRFFIEKGNINSEILYITGNEAHHIKDVIRLKPDDKFIGFDVEGFQYTCRISRITKDKIEAIIEKKQKAAVKIPDVALACAIPKLSRMDYIVQKAAELRVKTIIPMINARTEVKLTKQKAISKINRWGKIARESSKQCGRDEVLKIDNVKNFSEVIKDSQGYKIKLIPCLSDKAKPIRDILSNTAPDSALILIGPEGDFGYDEINLAIGAGFTPVSLGPLVLRVDTAAIFTVSAVMYEVFKNEPRYKF